MGESVCVCVCVCTLSHACHAKAAETKGHRRDARACIRPLGNAHCPTPATQKRRRPRDTGESPGCTSDPLAAHIVPRLPRKSGLAVHIVPRLPRKRRRPRDTGGTPGRTSDPLAVHIVPRLPRKSGGDQGTPEGRQGVHPTPWQCTLPHTCYAKAAETKGHRRDARAYIRPLGSAHCPTPATQKRRRPRDTGGTPGRTAWQCTLSHACHAKAAETKGHRRDARAYIRPLGSAHCPTPATQKRRRPRDVRPLGSAHCPTPAAQKRLGSAHCATPATQKAETKGHRRDARAYIRPLGSAHCPTPATQKRRRPRDTGGTPGRTSDPLAVHIAPHLLCKSGGDQGTPEGRQGVHPTPWQCTLSHACHTKAAETKGHRRDARAYIRPLGSAHCPTPATQKRRRPRDTGGTPGRTAWQCTLSHACHAKAAETKGHRRDARAYIRPLGSAHCPTPATQKRRRPRDVRPLGSAHCPTPATQKRLGSAHCATPATQKRRRPRDTGGTPGRTSDPLAVHIVPRLPRKSGGDQGTPEGRQGVHPTPWQCTLPQTCYAKAAETKGTPEGRQGVHPTPWQCTLPHACHTKAAETKGHRRDARAYIRPLGSAHCPTTATQKRRRPRDTGGTPGRTSDPLAVDIAPRLPRKRTSE